MPRSKLDWTMARRTLSLVTAVGLAGSPVAAQSVLRGFVLTEGGDPIRDAQVLQATVGAVGEFTFTTIPSGKFSVLARAIGFEPAVREFRFSGRDTVLAEFRLNTEPPNLDDLQVVAMQAIELYRGPSELPTQYQATGSACGAILLWSRTGEPE